MNPDFARIKQTTDLVAVVESYGIALIRTGAEKGSVRAIDMKRGRPNY